MGGSAFERRWRLIAVVWCVVHEGWSTGKTVVRLSKEKDPSTGGQEVLVGGFADFVSEFLE